MRKILFSCLIIILMLFASSVLAEENSLTRVRLKGLQTKFDYTNRIATDTKGKLYTKLREKPDVKSNRLTKVFIDTDLTVVETRNINGQIWHWVNLIDGQDGGWVEQWLVTGENPPKKDFPHNPVDLQRPKDSIDPDIMLQKINEHRESLGIKPYKKHEKLCELAKSRGPEINHEIFVTGDIHAGFYARDLSYYAVENAVGMGSVDSNMNFWLNSEIHRWAIENPDFEYSCGECWGGSCVQIFSSFTPRYGR